MKRYLVATAVLALGFLMCSVPAISLAQEGEAEELEYTWGPVSSVSSDQIVVIEYGYDTYEDVNVTYTLDPQVKLKNVESLKDIKVGDNAEIDYVVRGDTNVAKVITVEKSPQEKEYTPSQTYEEEPEYSSEEVEY